ncbi:hypothetical protein SAMD00019534_074150 [Acytostelium subglobosum LB1]|uniref:hypothetical protein n=1 Tax=Acytostelium subglobosum LB1 TaxID=1410327 RepID=UPI00064490FF|nr:hypothetical protein SAMD00019534_074150 [Acytostelium subglobosum LB1]GAM24240.1 hypothetical protein SAMD00019534_074150 [Acytostelium subglobosum LB1]|eukprot:XP_012752566.1 hypothetical protein SAMD00019534_074150 [Acytostelium subglobosum LB1]
MAKSYIDVSGDNEDVSPSVYAFFDKDRYFFECGEGSQRVYKERSSIKIGKIRTIFLTSLSWESLGGLMGVFYLLIAIEDVKEVDIYGPPGLYNIFYHSREFLNITLKVNVYEMNSNSVQTLNLEQLTVQTIPLSKRTLQQLQEQQKQQMDVTPFKMTTYHNYMEAEQWEKLMAATCAERKSMYVNVTQVDPSSVVDRDAVLCYIGITKDFPGRFYPERAIALGVPKGPMFHKLSNGQSVQTPKGDTVTPDQVMDKTQPGTRFAIIRCPTVEYFDSLFNSTAFTEYFVEQPATQLSSIVHLVPEEVLATEQYQQFMNKFGTATKHIIVNSTNCQDYKQLAAAEMEIKKLHSFLPSLFPGEAVPNQVAPLSNSLAALPNVIPCQKMTRAYLGPPASAGTVEFVAMDEEISEDKDDRVTSALMMHPKAEVIRQQIAKLTEELEQTPTEQRKAYPRVLFTGTSSAKPSKQRNVTGHLIETVKGEYMFMDCGEGTLGQVTRFFGREVTKDILTNLRLIWISHMHADHHLGVPLVLEKAAKARAQRPDIPRLVVIGPSELIDWLEGMKEVIHTDHIGFKFDDPSPLIDTCLEKLNVHSINNVFVDHCPDARGLVMEMKDGFKLSFSGDTRPSDNFIKEGKCSHIMIHEATFEDGLESDAIDKKHSTISEALQVGANMEAQWTMCTHFSQKTKCLNKILAPKSTLPANYSMAFDMLCVSPYQYPLLKQVLELIDLEEEIKQTVN